MDCGAIRRTIGSNVDVTRVDWARAWSAKWAAPVARTRSRPIAVVARVWWRGEGGWKRALIGSDDDDTKTKTNTDDEDDDGGGV